MKIVMLCEFYDESLQYQENLFAKYYIRDGHEVTVLTSTFNNVHDYTAHRYNSHDQGREYRDHGVKVIKLPYSLNLLNRLRKLRGVAGILARELPDVIFAHDIHLNLAEAAAYKRRNPSCKIIMDYHADYSNSGKNWISLAILHKTIRKRFLRRYRKYIDKIYPVVPVSAVFLNEVYGLSYDEMELLPLGADTDLAQSTRAEHAGQGIRQLLSIPSNALVIFTGGKLVPLKKTDVLLEAFEKLGNQNLHLLIVGDGDPEYVQHLRAQAGGDPRVHFIGWVESADVYRYMDACDFAVFPASQSVLWQQSLSMGLPLVVGDGTYRGGQDPSYLNLYENMIILRQLEVSSDSIAEAIGSLVGDAGGLKRRQASALRAADDLLDYHKLVVKSLQFSEPD